MAKRRTVTITIDSDLWELSSIMLPCSRSSFIERMLRNYINSANEIEQLEEEIKKEKEATKVKENKLEELKRVRELNNKNEELISKAMNTVYNIVREHKTISKQQIKNIANINLIEEEVLEDRIKKEEIEISYYTEDFKDKNINPFGKF